MHRLRWWKCLAILSYAKNSVVFLISFSVRSATTQNADKIVADGDEFGINADILFLQTI